MKKLFLMIVSCIATACFAQDVPATPFEGEIRYETYENCSDWLKKMGNSIYFDGVHQLRLIVKGNKMHLIDETTQCHTVVDASIIDPFLFGGQEMKRSTKVSNGYIHYCDLTKTGLDLSKFGGSMGMLAPVDLPYPDGTKAKLLANTFQSTGTVKNILGHDCAEYKGEVNHNMGGMEQRYELKAYLSEIPASAGYKWGAYCMALPKIATKWIMKYDGGHVSMMGVGELSMYVEADATEIIPREVADDEFFVPSGYKIAQNGANAFAMMKYYSGVKKALVKAGIKGGDNATKKTGVHYKTNDEWEF